eukprot:TRINITY_DN64508_c0_g1_i1.p1 TRINITY_DN64508_c0_g1~~TRINITY_DN64508_c0_g1_i1.p1  ORF type:complete len:369 (+),score=112.20 TRINITY_DN64508_c0_g1_i1:104-1210(+)
MVGFTKIAVVGLICHAASGKNSDASCSDEVAQLKKDLAAAKASLASCKSEPLSVVSAASGAYSFGADVVGNLLEKTSVDEQVADIVSDGLGKAKTAGAGVADTVMSVDYAGYVNKLKSHELYKTHVEKHLQPVLDQYVHPALEKAKSHVGPSLESVKTAGNQAFGMASEQAPKAFEQAGSQANSVLSKAFEKLAQVFPGYAGSFPESLMDRVLFLFLGTFLTYHLLMLALWALRINVKLAGVCMKLAKFAFFLAVTLPFRIVGFFFWIGTGFYCCGLCRRKAKKVAEESSSATAKGEKPATVDELKKLLDNAKKEKKLEAAVKQLLSLAKGGKAMTAPKNMEGKKVTKEILKQAVGKFKELDAKKLGL